ncbi:MAG: HD-GYP domain-containing protein [Oscillospiraceae bacterium]|nr:HD-GYP domain-containing protein [Oscillospiraceae bacterium]
MVNQNNLTTISIEYLYAGLVLQDDIYNYSGTLLLIPNGNTLTDNLIEQLKKFNNLEKNIKVSPRMYNTLLEYGAPQRARQADIEEKAGYTEAKNQTKDMLKIVEITNTVPYQQVYDIGELMQERLKITDPAVLFQCINGTNEVDEYLYRHSVDVSIINGLMGKWLDLNEDDMGSLVILGLVHDVGKTLIPPEILNKPGKLTDEEFEVIKRHSLYSHEILLNNGSFNDKVCEAARHHHEKMNGSGYPDHLAAEDISLYSRITSISDVYDAMVSKRVYKNAQSPFAVLKQMKEEQFWGLDIRLVNMFTEYMPRELLGKQVLMSNGVSGIVKHINDKNIEYPVVEVDGVVVATNKDLYCVSMLIDS